MRSECDNGNDLQTDEIVPIFYRYLHNRLQAQNACKGISVLHFHCIAYKSCIESIFAPQDLIEKSYPKNCVCNRLQDKISHNRSIILV